MVLLSSPLLPCAKCDSRNKCQGGNYFYCIRHGQEVMCHTDSPLVLSEESKTHFPLNQAKEVTLVNVGMLSSFSVS